MAKYTYSHMIATGSSLFPVPCETVLDFPIGKMPSEVNCPLHIGVLSRRDIFADAQTVAIDAIGNDDFRKYHLSDKREKAEAAQQRHITGPKDRSEARAIEAKTGRKYIGNDSSALTPREQQAIAKRG